MAARDIDEYLAALGERISGYSSTKSALHFPVDRPLDADLVRALLDVRLEQAGLRST